MATKAAAAEALKEQLDNQKREQMIAELATKPVETARRLLLAEEALKKIESLSMRAIHEYGITQDSPEKWDWKSIGDLVLKLAAPIRDAARRGMER